MGIVPGINMPESKFEFKTDEPCNTVFFCHECYDIHSIYNGILNEGVWRCEACVEKAETITQTE